VVVALGADDAWWAGQATRPAQHQARVRWVLRHLAPTLDELRDQGHCTVLVTTAARNKHYPDSPPEEFADAARRINTYLRTRAEADPNDGLRVADWAAHADSHRSTDPVPWFGTDTVQLNPAGIAAYANELTAAAALCRAAA
jgi:hypothetical protein